MRNESSMLRCANEGCGRQAVEGELLCETCCLEWSLFRRDARPERSEGLEPGSRELSPSAPAALRGGDVGSVRLR